MRATTIRFSDPIYQRLERASKYSGLPINAIVTAACMEWLRQQFPTATSVEPPHEPAEAAPLEGLLRGRLRDLVPLLFTDARDAIVRAEVEARRLNHEYLGTEHLLLGIVADDGGVGAQALQQIGVGVSQIREATTFIVGGGRRPVSQSLSLSPRAASSIDWAAKEAHERQDSEINSGHLLLGICCESESVALRILESVGIDELSVRASVEALMA